MNASSPSLPTGWITFWVVLGVVALAFFIALPLAISQRVQSELLRFQVCATKTQTTNCAPSLTWALNGWSLTSTTTTPVVSTTSSNALPASSTQPAR